MEEKSLIDLAYDVVSGSNKPVPFKEVWETVIKKVGLDETTAKNGIAEFYTGLTFDGRFVKREGNTWDLKSRYTYSSYHIDITEAYAQEEVKDNDNDPAEKDEDDISFEEPKPVDETQGFGNEEAEEISKYSDEGNENI